MKIGILTFHWATNYGAILQAYALQEHLIDQGHEVDIINYKPKQYDFSFLRLLMHPRSLLKLRNVLVNHAKEEKLKTFRMEYLNQTERAYTQEDVVRIVCRYDVLISGSDQILNPFFTLGGEGRQTSTYYLNFPEIKCRKIGYAVSFGCTQYPANAESVAKGYIQSFDKIGVREETGLKILSQLEFDKEIAITPDPTVLRGSLLFESISIKDYSSNKNYTCVYMIRRKLNESVENAIYVDEAHQPYSMEEWLGLICHSKMLITNSYHGMIMAILFHVPFVVDIETKNGVDMNDRFYTLLSRLNLTHRIVDENLFELLRNREIDWVEVDARMAAYRSVGEEFLKLD